MKLLLFIIAVVAVQIDTNQFPLFMSLSIFAHCSTIAPNSPFLCGPGHLNACDDGMILTSTKVNSTMSDERTGASAFLATNSILKQILVVFKGTTDSNSRNLDLDLRLVAYYANSSFKVHNGFQQGYLAIRSSVLKSVFKLGEDFPDYDIVYTGASLGGAYAAFGAIDLYNSSKPCVRSRLQVINFGQPRIGSRSFAGYVDSLSLNVTRVTNYGDPIAHLPPKFLGYAHFGTQYQIKNTLITLCSNAKDTLHVGAIDCEKDLLHLSFQKHLSYFNLHFANSTMPIC